MVNLLKNAIESFARDMSRHDYARSTWTERLFEAVSALGHRAGYVVAHSLQGADEPEWLYDLTWLSFDGTRQKRLLGVELAMESEWKPDYAAIMLDFNKLIQSRAKIKVMVCSNCGYNIPTLFTEAIAHYPGAEPCTYVLAVCNFGNSTNPVKILMCDEKGQMLFEDRMVALRRYLQTSRADDIHLDFEGFWPNKKTDFITDRRGFYFVFAGVRVKNESGYVAELHRLLYIGDALETMPFASGSPSRFERCCAAGEIPYFAFAEISNGQVPLKRILDALAYHFQPQINKPPEGVQPPETPLRFIMTGAVAECLGQHDFLV